MMVNDKLITFRTEMIHPPIKKVGTMLKKIEAWRNYLLRGTSFPKKFHDGNDSLAHLIPQSSFAIAGKLYDESQKKKKQNVSSKLTS